MMILMFLKYSVELGMSVAIESNEVEMLPWVRYLEIALFSMKP